MMIFISRVRNTNVLILAFFLIQSLPSFGQNSDGFAQYLMGQKDYFRAITIYKRLLFESKEKLSSYKYATQIAEAYRLSDKYKSSIYYYFKALQEASTTEGRTTFLIGLGLNYYHMKVPPIAKNYFSKAANLDTTGKAKLLLGLIEIEQMNWQKSQTTFDQVANSGRDSKIAETATLLSQKSTSGPNYRKKVRY